MHPMHPGYAYVKTVLLDSLVQSQSLYTFQLVSRGIMHWPVYKQMDPQPIFELSMTIT